MQPSGEPRYGFSETRLAAEPTAFAPGLFAGRVVVVTGAGGGLGRAIAALFARLGASLAICGLNPDKLAAAERFLSGFGGAVLALPMTIRDPAAVVAFLSGPCAKFITGAVLTADGGQQLWGDPWPTGRPDRFRLDRPALAEAAR